MAAMVVYSAEIIAELNKWVADVRRYAAPWQSQGEAGLPAVWKVSRKVNVPEIYRTLEASIKGRSWKTEELEQVAKAMALFSGPERQVRQNLRTSCSARAQPYRDTGSSPAYGSPAPLSRL